MFLGDSELVTISNFSGKVMDEMGAFRVGVAVITVHTLSGTEYGTMTDVKIIPVFMNASLGEPCNVTF